MTARTLFAPLGPTYDRYGALLSFGQDPRWRRFLVSRLDVHADERVLDVATGTGLVAREIVRRFGCSVVGVDQSPEMLAVARERTRDLPVELVEGRAEALPFADGEFASLTVTYLLLAQGAKWAFYRRWSPAGAVPAPLIRAPLPLIGRS